MAALRKEWVLGRCLHNKTLNLLVFVMYCVILSFCGIFLNCECLLNALISLKIKGSTDVFDSWRIVLDVCLCHECVSFQLKEGGGSLTLVVNHKCHMDKC